MKNTTRFVFVRYLPGAVPTGCLAYRVNSDMGRVEYEVSTHDPSDPFDRKMARDVASGRLDKHPRFFKFNKLSPPSLDFIIEGMYKDLANSPKQNSQRKDPHEFRQHTDLSIPERLRKALKFNLELRAEANADRQQLKNYKTDRTLDPLYPTSLLK